MLLGNLVLSMDARITLFESLGLLCSRPQKLVPRPVKFNPRLSQPFLNVETMPSLMVLVHTGLRSPHNCVVDFFSVSFLSPIFPASRTF